MEGVKYDQEKLRYDLLPWKPVEAVVRVLMHGARKYDDHNWKKVDGWRWRYFNATIRHLIAWWFGEQLDPESGEHHLSHAICCLLFIMGKEMEE